MLCLIILVLVLIDCVKTIDENVLRMVDKLRNLKAEEKTPPMLLVLNKVSSHS